MAAYKEFTSNRLKLRYFPEEKVVFLLPQKGIPGHYLNLTKNKLETFLPIDSVKQENGGISLKLSKNLSVQPEELFRSFGFQGGEDAEDLSSVAQQAAKNDLEKEQENVPAQPPNGPTGQPGGGNGPVPSVAPPNEQELTNESLLLSLYEFWSPHKGRPKAFKRHPKKGRIYTGKRSGKYWKVLERTLGKNREKITAKDVLHLRHKFGMQPYSESRNSSLRDLDRAYHYFLSKIKREKGEHSKEMYKREFDSQSDLKPSDYVPGKHEKKLDNDTFGAHDSRRATGLSLANLDLNLDKGEPGISYDDVSIEDEESIPRL